MSQTAADKTSPGPSLFILLALLARVLCKAPLICGRVQWSLKADLLALLVRTLGFALVSAICVVCKAICGCVRQEWVWMLYWAIEEGRELNQEIEQIIF